MSVITEGVVVYYPGYAQVQVQQNVIIQQISAISNSFQMTVTTTNPNNYKLGQKVTFIVPAIFGMPQLNNLVGTILSITSETEFVMNINSSNFYSFQYPMSFPPAYSLPYAIPYSSGPQIPPSLPLPDQTGFNGTVYNNGQF